MINNETRYNYVDENNNILFTKVRTFDPTTNSKSFYSGHEIDGQFITNLKDTRKVLYQLPQVLEAIKQNKPIFLCEGEKDVKKLMEYGLIATTTHSTSYWTSEFTTALKDAYVVILFDYDKTGIRRKDQLIQHLAGNVKLLQCIDLPGLEYTEKHGQDISDWFELGHTLNELQTLIEQAEFIHRPTTTESAITELSILPQSNQLKAIGLKEFVNMEIPKKPMLLDPIIPSQGLVMIAAPRGVGKTHIALGIAYAIATGDSFLRWNAPSPKKVLYIDGEMPATSMQERLIKIIFMSNIAYDNEDEHFHLITPDQQDIAMPDLSTQAGRNTIEPFIQNSDCIFIDNISCLFRTGTENDSESWQEAQSWILDLRRRGKAVVLIHHAGKNGNQRGTSKKEDILDTIMTLKHPEDYKPEQGACFEIAFSKARHFFGEDANSFIVQLSEDDKGAWHWEERESQENEMIQKYAELKAQGFTDALIGEKINKSKAQIETIKKKARRKGLVG